MKQVTTRSFTFAAITTFFFVSVREKTRDETIENPNKGFTEVRLITRSTYKITHVPPP